MVDRVNVRSMAPEYPIIGLRRTAHPASRHGAKREPSRLSDDLVMFYVGCLLGGVAFVLLRAVL